MNNTTLRQLGTFFTQKIKLADKTNQIDLIPKLPKIPTPKKKSYLIPTTAFTIHFLANYGLSTGTERVNMFP